MHSTAAAPGRAVPSSPPAHGRVAGHPLALPEHGLACRSAAVQRAGRRRRACRGAAAAAAAAAPRPPPPSAPASASASPPSSAPLRPPPPAPAFPALRSPDVAHFLNLTNGLEAAPLLRSLGLPFTLVRIQSTACEQQRFDALVSGADASLLAAAALGRTCLVWDFGSRGETGGPPRAVWYGLEFLAWAACTKWFPGVGGAAGRPAHLRGHDVRDVFGAALRGGRGWGADALSSPAGSAGGGGASAPALPPGFDPARSGVTKASAVRLRYFRRFVPPSASPSSHVRLWGAHRPTGRDGDAAWYVALAAAECGPGGGGGGGGGGAGMQSGAAPPPPPSILGPDGRVTAAALAADLAELGGFGLFTGGVPHDKDGGVPPAVVRARARRRREGT